jgi:beta-glucanase (GH16 family)
VPGDWKTTAGNVSSGSNGADFSIKTLADGPTIQSNFYIFFGYVEAVIMAAPGQGIVSSFILESDDLDEIDWEMIGSQTTQVQSNYFGKGNTTTYDRGVFHQCPTPAATWHTYAVDWKQDTTTWYIDGVAVRTLNFADAVGGKNYPQTPMNIRMGNWVAGQSTNSPGTVQWAGGLADMTKAPFNMWVKSVTVKNYNPASSYSFGDMSGSWQSIKMNQSTAAVSSGSNAGNVKASSALSVVTIVPGSKTSSVTSKSSTISISVKASSTTASALMMSMTKLPTVTINVGNSNITRTSMASLGVNATVSSKPAMVTKNDALRQIQQPFLALFAIIVLTLVAF